MKVLHTGLAAAALRQQAEPSEENWTRLVSELLYGDVLIDDGGFMIDDRGHPVIAVFSSDDAFRAARQRKAPSRVIPAVGLPDVLQRAEAAALVIDMAGPAIPVPLATMETIAGQRKNPAVRAALEQGRRARAAVLDALGSDPDAWLFQSMSPDSPAVLGTGLEYKTRSTAAPDGSSVLCVYTSQLEVYLRHHEDAWAARPVADVLRSAAAEYAGIILNPATSWIVLTTADLDPVRTRLAT